MRQLFPFSTYARILLVSVICAIPVVLLDGYMTTDPALALITKVVLYLTMFVVLSSLSGVCSKQDWLFLGRLVGARSFASH